MKAKFNLMDTARREVRRDKELFRAIMETLRVAERAGNRKCRDLLVRALSQA